MPGRHVWMNMCVPSSCDPCTTHMHTPTATKAPARALSIICRWGHQQQGQLLNQMKCWSPGALMRRETCRALCIRSKLPVGPCCSMISATQELKYFHKRHLLLHHQPIQTQAEYQEWKALILQEKSFFSFSQASLRDSVSKVSEYDEGYWYSLYHLQLPNVTIQNFSHVPLSLLQSRINTWCFQRIPSLHLLFCFHIFLLVYLVAFLKLLCYLGT